MSIKEWSVNAMSLELKRGRQTLDKIIADAGIRPVSVDGRSKKYRMSDIVKAMMDTEELNLQQERAKLAVEQTRKLERENNLADGKIADVELLSVALTDVLSQMVAIFEAIPNNIKRVCPEISSRGIEVVKKEIAKARNLAVEAAIETDN